MNQSLVPTIIKSLEISSFVFGIFLSSASIGSLIFSPIWGNLSDENGRKNFLIVGLFGYGLSQLTLISNISTEYIVLFRFVGGGFLSAYLTIIMAYLVDIISKEKRATFIAYFSAISTVGTSFGIFFGGYIGEYSIKISFIIQFLLIMLIIIFIKITLDEDENKVIDVAKNNYKYRYKHKFDINIFKENRTISMILICIIMLSIAITNYNSSISYYIENVFKMSPFEIGKVLSVTGLISLLMNTIVNPFLLKRLNEISIFKISAFLAGTSIILATTTKSIDIYFIFLFMYLAFSNLNMPLQQSIISKVSNEKLGRTLGVQSSARSIGMILGSLFAGIFFDINNNLPFFMCGALFILVSIILLFINKDDILINS